MFGWVYVGTGVDWAGSVLGWVYAGMGLCLDGSMSGWVSDGLLLCWNGSMFGWVYMLGRVSHEVAFRRIAEFRIAQSR